jgi:hypothetical protein
MNSATVVELLKLSSSAVKARIVGDVKAVGSTLLKKLLAGLVGGVVHGDGRLHVELNLAAGLEARGVVELPELGERLGDIGDLGGGGRRRLDGVERRRWWSAPPRRCCRR